jgi:hypothetical protein
MRPFIAALSLGCLLVLAAGCGEEESGPGAWAGDVCSSVQEWRENLTSLAVDAQMEGLSPDTVMTAIEGGVEATSRLRDQLDDLGPPDTEAGDEIEQELDALADSVMETAEEARDRAEALPENQSVPELIQSLMTIARDLQSVAGEAEATFDELEELEPGRELEEAFESSEDCQDLRQDGGG